MTPTFRAMNASPGRQSVWIGGTILLLSLALGVGHLAGPGWLTMVIQLAIAAFWLAALSVLQRRWRETDESRQRTDV